jgi:hypothetical protein
MHLCAKYPAAAPMSSRHTALRAVTGDLLVSSSMFASVETRRKRSGRSALRASRDVVRSTTVTVPYRRLGDTSRRILDER